MSDELETDETMYECDLCNEYKPCTYVDSYLGDVFICEDCKDE